MHMLNCRESNQIETWGVAFLSGWGALLLGAEPLIHMAGMGLGARGETKEMPRTHSEPFPAASFTTPGR